MSGYVDFVEYGSDLVCVGVFFIVFGMVNVILEVCDFEFVIEELEGYFYYFVFVDYVGDDVV